MTPAFGRVWAEAQDGAGRIEGSVTLADGSPVKAITVRIVETDSSTTTNDRGEFSFASVPAGTYELAFTRLGRNVTRPQVTVREGTTTTIDQTVDWLIAFAETITVYGVSKQRELVVKAPAAVSRVSEKTIEREAAHGQLPKLVEFTPGAQITQSGLYDFNLNTRGFNSLATRRVSVLIDGRQFARSNLAAPIWTDVSTTLDDQFVRGPSGALHGVNASSGVLSVTTRAPRNSQGGTVRFTAGEVDTINFDFRWADPLGKDW